MARTRQLAPDELPKNVKTIERVLATPPKTAVRYKIIGEKGLRLAHYPTGKATWLVRFQVGKGASRREYTRELGDATLITLADAATAAEDKRRAAEKGEDPDAANTFGELFQLWLEEHAKKQLRTWADEERRYHLHLEKGLGNKRIADIARGDVREVRDTVLEEAGPIQSNRVVALFNRVMNWAVDEGRARANPAALLKKVGEERRRERALTPDELRRLWHELGQPLVVDRREPGKLAKGGLTEADIDAAVATRRAIKLLIALGQRRGEVIGMAKDELDIADKDNAWWTIPGERTKNKLPHRVPLNKLALKVLAEAIQVSGDSPYVFPSTKTDGPIRPDAVTKQLQRTCRKMDPKIEGLGPHDIRRTVGTMLRKAGVSVEDRGYVFNHISGAKAKVTSWNYDAGEHDMEKRRALETWERELERVVGLPVGKDAPPTQPATAAVS